MDNININLSSTAVTGDIMLDSRDKTYYEITGISNEKRIALGYRYTDEMYTKQSKDQRIRNREADIVSLIDLVLHYKKVLPRIGWY